MIGENPYGSQSSGKYGTINRLYQRFRLSVGIISLLFLSRFAVAQNPKTIDSLQKVLKTNISDTQKVDVYNLMAEEYRFSDSVKVAHYTTQAMRLAKKINYPAGIADALYFLGWITMIQGHYSQATEFYRQALQTAQKINYKKGIANAHNGTGNIYYNQGNYPKALHFFQYSLTFRKQIGDNRGIASSYNNIGGVYYNQGDYLKALEFFQHSLALKKQIGYKRGLGWDYQYIGHIHENQGNYLKALEFHQKALKNRKEIRDKLGIAYSYNNIGNIYRKQGNYPKALEHHQHSLVLKKQIGYKRGIAWSYNSMGEIYQNQGNHSKALQLYQKSLRFFEQIRDKNGIAKSNLNLGKLALAQQQFKNAKTYFEKALTLRQEMGQKALSAEVWVSLGIAYYTQETYTKAQNHLNKGIQTALKTRNPAIVRDGAEYLAKVYQATGKFREALENHVLFKQMADSLFSKKNIQKITRLEEQFTAKKREDSLQAMQTKKNTAHQVAIKKQKVEQQLLLAGSTALILILALLFSYLNKRRSNRKLATQNTRLSTQNNLINLLLNENQHQVGNDFLAVYTKIAAIDKTQLDKENQQLMRQAKERVNEAMELQDLLRYPFHAGEQNFDHAAIEEKLYTIAHTLYQIHFQATGKYTVIIRNKVHSLDQNRFAMISFCVFELVKNVCKHAFRDKTTYYPATVDIDLNETQAGVTLCLKSNGKGLSSALFDATGEFDFKKQKNCQGHEYCPDYYSKRRR